MPNYVYSNLYISGDKKDLDEFKKRFSEEGGLKAGKVIPYPREFELLDKYQSVNSPYLKEEEQEKLTEEEERELTIMSLSGNWDMDKAGYNQGGYEWCNKNWNTKWGFCDCDLEEDEDDHIKYVFTTAWSPITPVIVEMSKQFPNLTLEYSCEEESGMFAFTEEYQGGELTYEEDRTEEYQQELKEQEEDEEEEE